MRRRERRRLGGLDGGVDVLARGDLDLLELGRSGQLQVEQVPLRALDRVARLAHRRDLVAVAVRDAWVGHRVAVVAVRVHLHHDGALGERVHLGEARRLAHIQHVHAVHLDARHVVAARVVVRVGRRAPLARAHAVLVVLAHLRGKTRVRERRWGGSGRDTWHGANRTRERGGRAVAAG
eukprot:2372604-Prymnesium_polylepis.1